MNKVLLRMFYLLLAAIAFFELVLSNLFTLAFNLGPTARTAGLTVQMEILRLAILIALDAAAGLGALAASEAVRRQDSSLLKKTSLLAFIGFGVYALYQLASSWLLLSSEFKLPTALAGLAYGAFGILAFHFGRTKFPRQAG
jgi:hypothetical protein